MKKQYVKEMAKLFSALGSEKNILLLLQIYKKPMVAGKIKTELSVMPLNRRLNILKEAGLIERVYLKKMGRHLENRVSPSARKILKSLRFLAI